MILRRAHVFIGHDNGKPDGWMRVIDAVTDSSFILGKGGYDTSMLRLEQVRKLGCFKYIGTFNNVKLK